MGKLAEKAKFIDMYASLPRLSFGKDGKVYSRLGLLLTFLTVFIIGGMAIWIGIRIFGRHTPAFLQYDLPPLEYDPTIPFNLDDFKFGAIVIRDDQESENDLVSYSASFYDKNSNLVDIEQTTCQFDFVVGLDLNCWKQKQSTKDKTVLAVKGARTFNIQYDYCTDKARFNCKSKTDADFILKYGAASFFFYEDLLINPFDYENPLSVTGGFTTNQVLLAVGTTMVVELNEVEFISDNGWIFQDLKTITKLKPSFSTRVSTTDMLSIQIKYGGNKTVYKRTYPKIQDFFAQISGFITIITPIFLILVSPYGNLQAIQHMTNEIYEIKLNKPNHNNGGDSPLKHVATKKRRQPFKCKGHPSITDSLTSPKETESDLLPQKVKPMVKPKPKALTNQKSVPFSPHAALVIGGLGKLPTREETPAVAEENTKPLHFDIFDKSPSKTTPNENYNNLGSPEKPFVEHAKICPSEDRKCDDERLSKDLEAKQGVENNEGKNIDEDSEFEEEGEEEGDVPIRTSDSLEVPWQTWLKSFWRPNPEVQILKKSKEHLDEAFDLVTLAKKVIEIDKMKACLFTHDQRVIFENLPSSVIVLNPDIDIKSPEAIKQYHWRDSFKGDQVALRKAYSRLQGTKNELDQLLLKLYQSEYIDDGASL